MSLHFFHGTVIQTNWAFAFVYFSNSSIPKSPLCPTFLFYSHSFLFISYTFRLLHQSPSSAAASYATGASSPPPWLFYTNRGACSWGRPSPGGPSFCDCCCSCGCCRGGPSWRRPDHPNSMCEAHPPTAKLHQPIIATTHGDHRSQGVHLHAATVQWVQLHNLYNVTSDTWHIGTWQSDEISIK